MSTRAAEPEPSTEGTGPILLDRLSDEELVLLGAEHPLVHLPHHARLSGDAQEHAVVGAMRGLRARGHEVDRQRRTITLPQHVDDLLDLRACAPCVLMVQVLVPDHDDETRGSICQHYGFVVEDFVVLEDVSPDGLHDFWAMDLPDLATELQARVPSTTGALDGSGGPLDVDLMAVAAGESQAGIGGIGRPLAQIDATVWRAPATPDPPLLAIVLGDRGSYVSVASAGTEGPVTLTPVSVSRVGEQVVTLLGGGTMTR